jgi:hypothetical protein
VSSSPTTPTTPTSPTTPTTPTTPTPTPTTPTTPVVSTTGYLDFSTMANGTTFSAVAGGWVGSNHFYVQNGVLMVDAGREGYGEYSTFG